MKKTKIILFLILNLIFLEINTAYTSISNTIIANVGSEIITSYELKNKIRIVLFLTGQELSQTNIDKAKETSLGSLINYKVILDFEKNCLNIIFLYLKT